MNNLPDILHQIIERKRQEMVEQKQAQPLVTIQAALAENPPPLRGFANALRAKMKVGNAGIIAEIKHASPSKGLLCKEFYPALIAQSYAANGATCLSVLTDKDFFQGDIKDLIAARNACNLPVLRKDFIIDAYQVYQTRACGADAILLIAASLEDKDLYELTNLAQSLGLDVLLEVHDDVELERGLKVEPNIIGINNRNLRDFTTDLNITLNLVHKVPSDGVLVTESGIRSKADVELMQKHGIHGFLVGESLMCAADPGRQLVELFF